MLSPMAPTGFRSIRFFFSLMKVIHENTVDDDFSGFKEGRSALFFEFIYPAEGYGIKYEGSFLEKSQSGCVQNFCHFVCLHHFWA